MQLGDCYKWCHKFVHPPCGQASATSLTNQSPLEMCLARPLTQGPPTASTRASKQSESDNATKLFYACLKIPLYPNMAMEDHGANHDLPKFYEILLFIVSLPLPNSSTAHLPWPQPRETNGSSQPCNSSAGRGEPTASLQAAARAPQRGEAVCLGMLSTSGAEAQKIGSMGFNKV